MSLINKMLQDLDARGNARGNELPQEIQPVPRGGGRRPALRIAAITAALLVAALGATAWWVFPLKGKTYDVQPAAPVATAPGAPVTVAEVAPAPAPAKAEPVTSPAAAAAASPAPDKPPARQEAASPAPAARPRAAKEERLAAPAPAPARAATSWAVANARAQAEQERLAKRWQAAEARLATLAPGERADAERRLRAEQSRAAARARRESDWLAALARREAGQGAASGESVGAAATGGEGRLETGAQAAENGYRRALATLQEGRVSEAIGALQGVLRANPKHEAARQTLVGLLIEANRGDEAMVQLQTALALDARQPAMAMLLARLQIERGKPGIDTLLRTLPYATGNGDYHAFLGGALQHAGRYREAAEQYQNALRAAPDNAVWWMGLGVALQADKRNPEAADALRRARALGSLNPELQAFVERRLAQVAR